MGPLEDLPSDQLAAFRDQPAAHLVAPAEVNSESDLRMAGHYRVVQFEALLQPLLEAPATPLIKGAPARVYEQWIVGRVQLHVGRAQSRQLRDLLPIQIDHVGQELIQGRIRAAGDLRRPEVGVEPRTRQRDLGDLLRTRPQVCELFGRQVAAPAQLTDDTEPRRPADALTTQRIALPVAPEEGLERHVSEAVRRLRPSATTSSPASSWRRTAPSTALSSTALKSAGEIAPASNRPRASMSSGGRSRLPTTSVWHLIKCARTLLARLQRGDVLVVPAEPLFRRSRWLDHDHQPVVRVKGSDQASFNRLAARLGRQPEPDLATFEGLNFIRRGHVCASYGAVVMPGSRLPLPGRSVRTARRILPQDFAPWGGTMWIPSRLG